MTLRRIRFLGDPVLRKRAEPVGRLTPEVRALFTDLRETLDASEGGIGLAAPQIGVSKRVILVRVPDEDGRQGPEEIVVNPEIVRYDGDVESQEEGCLSIPHVRADVERPHGVEIRGLDAEGRKIRISAEGLRARCFLHEIDHLDGKLFIDHAGIPESEAVRLMRERIASGEKI
jgi:peptide deformylase